ncbi:hypothetical protein [Pseudomonas sp. FW300-N2A2]|uniref:hypothetical protein n=1 Tax=Pseudomonas sp. FW300-N2A2 TaxID=2751316 RepID=UPI001A910AD7|nr:hypothetical protein [Pseudomonas sp. FW300-N2A2]
MRNLFQETHASFKNFHRALCARFGYVHDERDWQRDQVSLEEHIAGQIDRLRQALAGCTESLAGEFIQKYQGQQPDDMHPVTRRDYDRDMAEIEGYKAISKESP